MGMEGGWGGGVQGRGEVLITLRPCAIFMTENEIANCSISTQMVACMVVLVTRQL